MGQKVDPRGFRTGITRGWVSEWFAPTKAKSSSYLVQDLKVRIFTERFYKYCGISKIVFRKGEIGEKIKNDVLIFTAKPALVLGKDGKKLKKYEKALKKNFKEDFNIVVKEVSKPEMSAKIMAEYIAQQLEKRMPYRRVIKSVIEKVMTKGLKGIKVQVAGRLNGAEMARTESFKDGRIPLQTLRADIDYHYIPALTKYGILGVKVWIYRGDIENNRSFKKNLSKKKKLYKRKVTKKL